MNPETQHHLRLAVRSWSRNLHIYISMFGLQAILFFSLTGFMLNHSDWFGSSEPTKRTREASIPAAMIQTPNELTIVEHLRKYWGATGELNSFDTQDDELRVVFKSPARRFEAVINRPDGHMQLNSESYGFFGRVMELHRGEDAGPVWSFLIDTTAVVLILTSLTGLTLWLLIAKWRNLGLLCLGSCLAIGGVVYFFFVP
jgi:uncharacterized protein